jgi:predicted lipoprotein with Yx(FWY)xxD motif
MAHLSGKKLSAFAGLALAAALGLAACGGAGSGGGAYGSGGGSGTTSSPAGSVNLACASGAVICTKTVSVSGKSATALADTNGMTLYYFTPDSAMDATCSGSCAQLWPPLAAGASVTGTGLSGTLTALNGANGAQVVYNGHPLYRYSGDKAQSDTNGEGILGKWFVATGDLAAGSGGAPASGSPTKTPSGGYGGGGY